MGKSIALVVLSGGQDSATCLAYALTEFETVKAITFDYGQRHRKEIEAAKRMCEMFRVDHKVINVPSLITPSNALTNKDISISADGKNGLPNTFVPCRNIVFLSLASACAISEGIKDIVTGVCQTDYSGYPDCRATTITALQLVINLGNDTTDFEIHTPLMYLTKAETIALMRTFHGKYWQLLKLSWTCYEGGEKPCGDCPACRLRSKGFEEYGCLDPALEP